MRLHAIFIILVLLAIASPSQAALMVDLSATAPDLNDLQIGDGFTVNVNLSGLQAGDRLEFLAVTVTYQSPLLGTPTVVTPGPIVPDVAGFTGARSPGVADGLYDNLFTTLLVPIDSNGVFYSFHVMAQQAGAGTIAFGFVDSTGFDGLNSPLPKALAGNSLSFLINAATSVPEPSSIGVWSAGLAALVLLARRRRRIFIAQRVRPGATRISH